MSFYTYMMRNYKRAESPEGDLARDMELDRDSFPRQSTGKFEARHRLIREYLESCNACSGCLDAFERCWKEYVEFCRRRKNKEEAR